MNSNKNKEKWWIGEAERLGNKVRQPLPTDYGLTDSSIEQIRSMLRYKEIMKNRCINTTLLVGYITTVALTWSRFGLGSFMVGFLGICILGIVFGLPISFLINKYFEKKVMRIKGSSSLKEYEYQLAQYKEFKEKRRIEEERKKAKEEKERKRKPWDYWMGLSPRDFENEVAELFKGKGYDTRVTPVTGDGGVDIILSKEGKEVLVQCKKYKSSVGPAPVRELYGVMSSRCVKEGFLVCPAGFTSGAYDFAKRNGIRLIGLKRLIQLAGTNK